MPSKPTAAILLRNAYGVKEFGKPDKVDTNTLLMIGSNTKVVNLRYGQ